MLAFIASFIKYAVIFVILAAIGVAGGFAGARLRMRKNAKDAAAADSGAADLKKTEE